MPYADPLTLTTPASNAIVSGGPDIITQLKRAISERLLTVFTDLSVDPLVFLGGVVPGAALVNNSITATQLAALAVTNAAVNDVSGAKITAASIPSTAYGALSVLTAAIADLNVTTGKLADSAVTTAKLNNASVTAAKLDSALAGTLLEMREVDYVFAGATVASGVNLLSASQTFTGLIAGDALLIGIPQVHVTTETAPYLLFQGIANTDSFKFNILNMSGGPITMPACTFKIYCIKLTSSW